LLGEWLSERTTDRDVAWLSLDRGDSDATRFWSYVVAALQVARPGLGSNALVMLRSPQPTSVEAILTTLLNEIAEDPRDLVLILDDYHVIEAAEVHDALAFLVDNLPPHVHMVILSRADPALPLARLRARNQLVELRAADLRFTPREAAAFLNDVMGLDLAAADVEALEQRTEGWIAGLQLAALSMQGRNDLGGFISAFTGDDRYVVDYLVEEVLARESPAVREFLLYTSILDRLSGPLCDQVTGQQRGREMLESLDRRNLFMVPLDNERRWYRYHHLFADVLRAHLRAVAPDIDELHRRASEWFEEAGEMPAAITHALHASDYERAARLIEAIARELVSSYRPLELLAWTEQLPEDAIVSRPVLTTYHAFALFPAGHMQRAAASLDVADRWLSDPPARLPPGTDTAEVDSLPGIVAVARGYHAMATGNIQGTIEWAQRAIKTLPEEEHTWRGGADLLLALAEWWTGDLGAAAHAHAAGAESLIRSGDLPLAISALYDAGTLAMARGALSEAQRAHERSLRLVEDAGTTTMPGVADAHLGLSTIALERGDLEAATKHLEEAEGLTRLASLPETPSRVATTRALLHEAAGEMDAAIGCLDEAERVHVPGPVPDVAVDVYRARMLLRRGGDLDEWIAGNQLSSNDRLMYPREAAHVVLARVLVEREPETAMAFIDQLMAEAREGDRARTVLELLLLNARAHQASGRTDEAMAFLREALRLAEPEGYVRPFILEGRPIRGLLRAAVGEGSSTAYASRLLKAFGDAPSAVENAALPEPLTAREVEILRLVASGMRNQEIADHLVISVATVKRHIANTYGKLGTDHRTEAVARANELRLI